MNLRRYDLNLLVIVEAVLRERSIVSAALHLNVSQPAVSQSLQRARSMFADPLMVRRGRGLVPTARGEVLQMELSELLRKVEFLIEGPAFEPSLSRRIFSIMASDLGEMTVLRSSIPLVASEAPSCRFEIHHPRHDLDDIPPDLLLMGAEPPAGQWLSQSLFDDHFVIMARKEHPALLNDLSVEAFAALPQVLVSPRGDGGMSPVDAALASFGLRRNISVLLSRFSSLASFLAGSDLVAVAPSRFADLEGSKVHCAVRSLPFRLSPFTMRLVWHTSRDVDEGNRWLRERIMESVTES